MLIYVDTYFGSMNPSLTLFLSFFLYRFMDILKWMRRRWSVFHDDKYWDIKLDGDIVLPNPYRLKLFFFFVFRRFFFYLFKKKFILKYHHQRLTHTRIEKNTSEKKEAEIMIRLPSRDKKMGILENPPLPPTRKNVSSQQDDDLNETVI